MVRIIVGVKRADKGRMDEMIVEVRVTESAKKKLARSTWAGHVERMTDEKPAKRKYAQKWKGNGDEADRNCDGVLH